MTIINIKTQLEKYSAELLCYNSDTNIRKAKLFVNGIQVYSDDLLVGRAEDFIRFGIPVRASNILCIGYVAQIALLVERKALNCLVIKGPVDIFYLQNELTDILFTQERLSKCTNQLLSYPSVVSGGQHDLNKVLEVICETLSNPVAFFSTPDMATAFYENPANNSMVFTGIHLEVLIRYFGKIIDSCDRDELATAHISNGINELPMRVIISPIPNMDQPVYYLLIFEQTSFQETDVLASTLLSGWISSMLKIHSIKLDNEEFLVTQFIKDMINKEIVGKENISNKAISLNIENTKYFRIVLLDTSKMKTGETSTSLGTSIAKRIRGVYFSVIQDYIVFLLASNSFNCKNVLSKIPLEDVCTTHDLRSGISYCYNSLEDTATAFEQAKAAIEISSRFEHFKVISDFDDVLLYYLLLRNGLDKLYRLSHPQLLNLVEYDNENNTQYTHTLYTMLRNGGNQSKTARALDIHRSTMQYRIKKIVELIDLDLTDNYNIVRLYISFGILSLTGVLDPSIYNTI